MIEKKSFENMKEENFALALAITLRFEGGWYPGTLKGDPNPTMRGITQKTYDGWRTSQGLPLQSVRNISDDELQAIYYTRFWQRAECGTYTWPLCALVFDWSVNSGPNIAVKELAAAKQASGPQATDQTICAAYMLRRWQFLERLMLRRPETTVFRRGWAKRVNALCDVAGVPRVAPL